MKQLILNMEITPNKENGIFRLECIPDIPNPENFIGYGWGETYIEALVEFIEFVAEDKNCRYWSMMK